MTNLGSHFESAILASTGASSLEVESVIQELCSGYGHILRVSLEGGNADSVVVKHIRPAAAGSHPRGWNSTISHERKVRSYEVETAWYREWSDRCDEHCRIPQFLAFERHNGEVLLVLEDLDAAGFPRRMTSVEWTQIEICLGWLANFHATFLGDDPHDLWPVGSYWHLDTRPEELEALADEDLRQAASAIDARLNA
ncbi:MAG: choline kinase, partial [Verrucomicrobiota bacterium]